MQLELRIRRIDLAAKSEDRSKSGGAGQAPAGNRPKGPIAFGRFVMRQQRRFISRSVALAGLAAALFFTAVKPASCAEAEADFYKGKQIHLLVSTAAGGIYDAFARLIAQFMPDHLDGHPTIVVQNMPGTSGLKVTNYLYNDAPRDGTYIAAVHNGIPTAPFEEPEATHFDVNQLSWIGSISEDPFVGYVWYTAPIKTYEDAKKIPVVMASATIRSMGTEMSIISNAFFGTKFKIVTGYESGGTVKLAMERGELQGTFANSWGDLKEEAPDWIRDHKVRIIIQHGFHKDPDLPDVPLFVDQAKSDDDRQALDLMLARQDFARPYIAPPGLPAGRLDLLRQAFDATIHDPRFVAAAQDERMGVDHPMTGDALAKRVAQLSATPAAVTQRLTKVFEDFVAEQR
jgi:tripartite-type tricarboxylate transporter receptor subunit TctC